MSSADPDTPPAEWLDAWFDLDAEAQARVLADAEVPAAWRAAAARLQAAAARVGVLDRDPTAVAEGLLGAPPAVPKAGDAVGRYCLDALIGQGGMATVWSARHQDPQLPQRVAIKFLRTTLFTPEWRERFLREQRILARLNHPCISRLFDAGLDRSGAPYLAMELIEGEPIGAYCDARGLDCATRVRLFLKVCAAVAYAHRNLVVHRDLKPGNVLVGGDGEPHLLDFGIAKLLDATGAERDRTGTGLHLLTPAYAAPEQLAQGDITTATDVYGLGALLHELLSAARPQQAEGGWLQRPSARVDAAAAARRGLHSAAALRAQLRGDLDAILERALRREPELRYASAHEFGEDLERWLRQETVRARADNWRYRSGKFVRRHRLALALVLAAVLGLALATVVSVRASLRADRAAAAAVQEAERARRSRDFVLALLHDLRPGASSRTPERLLDRAAARIEQQFGDDPESRVELQLVLGELERGYSRLAPSRTLLERASATARRQHGGASPLWLRAEASLAHTAFREGTYRDGASRLQKALAEYDGAGGEFGAARISALSRLGQLRDHAEDSPAALALHTEADTAARRLLAADDPLRLEVRELYGEALAGAGQDDAARAVLRENLAALRARYGDRDLAVVSALESLALREIEADAPQAALALLLEARAIAASILDGPHVIAGYVENSLGLAALYAADPAQASQAFERALAIFKALLKPPHPLLEATHANRGEAAFERGDFAAAVAAFAAAQAQREALDPQSQRGAFAPSCLAGEAYTRGGDATRALALLEPCVGALQRRTGAATAQLATALALRAEAEWRAGRSDAAQASALQALASAPADSAHAALVPLRVLAEIELQDRDAGNVRERLDAVLAIAPELPRPWPRPCDSARQLSRLAEIAVQFGDAARATALRNAAGSCNPAAPLPQPPQ
ncbi:MAG: serine/threonine protein kinase [Xanthomonadales bacterium]|nr:serine/threonine protein kinase [Xanthomonadales bacterium]